MAEVIQGTENFGDGPYLKPSPKESGNDVFDILEEFMERIANHSHNGNDSKSIAVNIDKSVQDLVIGVDFTWDAVSSGVYRASIPVADGTTFDNNVRTMYYVETLPGPPPTKSEPKIFYPNIEKIDDDSYYVYTNDNTIDLKVVTI